MIKLSEIKTGDIVNARFEDVINTGEVTEIDGAEKKILVAHGDQEFWYSVDDLSPIPLTVNTLETLGFMLSPDLLLYAIPKRTKAACCSPTAMSTGRSVKI